METYKEELRAYEYMVSRGYATEAKTQEQLQEIVNKFQKMTAKHPGRSVKAVLDKWAEEEEKKLQSYRSQHSKEDEEKEKVDEQPQIYSDINSNQEDDEAQPLSSGTK